MKTLSFLLFTFTVLFFSCQSPVTQVGSPVLGQDTRTISPQVVTYDPPYGFPSNTTYTVQVRTLPSGTWQELYEYDAPVDANNPGHVSVVNFDFNGSVEVKVTYNAGGLSTSDIKLLPRSYSLVPSNVTSNSFTFELNKPRNVTVEVKNQDHANLHLFTNSVPVNPPIANGAGVMYFGPGYHHYGNDSRITAVNKNIWVNRNGSWVQTAQTVGILTVPSNTRVYLAGGAIFQGKILIKNANNVTVDGPGFIDQRSWTDPGVIEGIEINKSTNVNIRDITVLNGNHYDIMIGQSSFVDIRRFKGISDKIYGDGIDMMSSSDITIDDVFLRSFDDSIAIYGQRVWEEWDFRGDSTRITVSNAVFWPDIAHGINIGCHGNLDNGTAAPMGNLLSELTFRNIEILYHNNAMNDPNLINEFQGTLAINVADGNTAKNVTFDTVNVERIKAGQLVNFIVMNGQVFNGGIGKKIENVLVKNLTYYGDTDSNDSPSRIKGYDSGRPVTGVTFENLRIGGTLITAANASSVGNISVESNASNVTYTSGAAPVDYYGRVEAEASSLKGQVSVATVAGASGQALAGYDSISGDWSVHTFPALPATQAYKVRLRVSSVSGGAQVDIEQAGGSPVFGRITIPATGSDSTWSIVESSFTLPAGLTDVGVNLKSAGPGFNLDWIELVGGNASAPNTPPTVTLTSPTNNGSVVSGTAVSLLATASDSDGTVASVEFFAGSTSLGIDTSSPFGVNWTPTTSGVYVLTAKATDNAGATTISAASNLTVTAPASGFSIHLEAENADYKGNVTLGSITDGSPGQAFTGYDNASGDWSTHPFGTSTSQAGIYEVRLRVATAGAGAMVNLEQPGGALVYGNLTLPATGGLNSWSTVKKIVWLPAGVATVGINLKSAGPGFSLNWLEVSAYTPTFQAQVEAENADYKGNVAISTVTDGGTAQALTGYDAASGDWSTHPLGVTVPTAGTYTLLLRVASSGAGGNLQFLQSGGGATYGSTPIPATGGLSSWQTISVPVTLPAGISTIGLNLSNAAPSFSVNWFKIVQ